MRTLRNLTGIQTLVPVSKQDRKVVKRGHCGLRRSVHSQKSIHKIWFRVRIKAQTRHLLLNRGSATGRLCKAQLNGLDQGNQRRKFVSKKTLAAGLPHAHYTDQVVHHKTDSTLNRR